MQSSCPSLWTGFVKMAFWKKNAYFSEQVKSLTISTNIKTSNIFNENECLMRSEIMFMMFNRLPEKKPEKSKIAETVPF